MRRGAAAAWLAFGLVLAATTVLGVRWQNAGSERPNIVVILIDTVRRDHFPFYGYSRDTAPFLTSLAARAVVFDQAYSTSGWTSPATASLFTSLYPFQHGVIAGIQRQREEQFKFHRLPRGVETMAQALKRAGYATYAISDNIHVSPLTGFDPGFDAFESASDASAVAVNKRAKKWRGEMQARAPYFLYLHYLDPHEPYLPRAPWYDEFYRDSRPALSRRDFEAAHDSEIRFVDEKIAGLFQEFGWEKDTVVVVTADHGEEFGDHGYAGHAHTLHAELVNVPLLVYRGGTYGPKRVPAAVSVIDVLPTLREVVGLPEDPRNEGESLVPLLTGGTWPHGDRALFSELVVLGNQEVMTAAIRKRWKLISYQTGEEALYDLARDPREQADRSSELPDLREDLRAQYAAYAKHARKYTAEETAEVELDPESVEKLRALGYIK
jgi:choline-sulfatase